MAMKHYLAAQSTTDFENYMSTEKVVSKPNARFPAVHTKMIIWLLFFVSASFAHASDQLLLTSAQSAKRRARIKELTNFAETLVKKLDAQDALAEKLAIDSFAKANKKTSAEKSSTSKAHAKSGAVQNTATVETNATEALAEKGRKASDRGAYSRFQKAVSEAKLTRFIKADFHAESFSYDVNESAIEAAERFDGKLVLLSNVADFSAEKIIERYKALADIERKRPPQPPLKAKPTQIKRAASSFVAAA